MQKEEQCFEAGAAVEKVYIDEYIPKKYQLIQQLKMAKDIERYPNLSTVLMVEKVLEKHRAVPIKITALKEKLPKQVMHNTLRVILEYLWESGKIIYGPKGVQWIYSKPAHLNKMLKDSLEI